MAMAAADSRTDPCVSLHIRRYILILFGSVLAEILRSLTPDLVITTASVKVFGAKGSGVGSGVVLVVQGSINRK